MTCPHCGFENQEGRKYCRGCAKSLAAPPAVVASGVSTDVPGEFPAGQVSSDSSGVDSPASPTERSFESDFASLAAPVPGISRNLMAVAAVLVFAIGTFAFWWMHSSSRAGNAQDASATESAASAAYAKAAAARTREHVTAALNLIVAQQEARLADDPDDLNVCAVNVFGNDKLGQHVRQSHYIFDQQCQPQTGDGHAIRNGFTVTATPKLADNPSDAPAYCVDQTKITRRYTDSTAVSNATSVQHLICPLDGQPLQ